VLGSIQRRFQRSIFGSNATPARGPLGSLAESVVDIELGCMGVVEPVERVARGGYVLLSAANLTRCSGIARERSYCGSMHASSADATPTFIS
jgi:hypothetical protein